MSKRRDIAGHRFGHLIAVRRAGSIAGKSIWECRCDCGGLSSVRLTDLTTGKVKSCGCVRREILSTQGAKNATHGASHTRLYGIWLGMKQRCQYKNGHAYGNYGGRGVSVCDEWMNSFVVFRDWAMANGYRDDLSIDRKDTNGPYAPWNCRWSTMEEQQNNRRNNLVITCGGTSLTLSQWAKRTGIPAATISWRVKAGWPENELFIPVSLSNAKTRKEMMKNAQ